MKGVAHFSHASPMVVTSSVVFFNCFVMDSWTLTSVSLAGLAIVGIHVVS
jgi:hypothetical protein